MKAYEIRAEARNSLSGQWGKIILAMIIYIIAVITLSFVLSLIPLIGMIVNYIISIPLSVGFTSILLNITKRENFSYFDFINVAIELFGKSWGVVGHTLLKLWKPIVLYVLAIVITVVSVSFSTVSILSSNEPSIAGPIISLLSSLCMIIASIWMSVKGLLYSLSNLILVDNPHMTSKEVVEASAALMNGNRLKLIFLGLSFIGWYILAAFTLCIGFIWLIPYMAVSGVIFYLSLANKSEV